MDVYFKFQTINYMLLTHHTTISKELHIAQLKLSFSPKELDFAKNI